MHEYSVDTKRNKVIFYLAVISVFVSTGINSILNMLIEKLPLNGFVISITVVSVFGSLYALFNKYLWKIKLLYKIGIVQTPNVNGAWEGHFVSSYHNWEKDYPAKLVIEQTWSEICIIGRFNDSTSKSYTAAIKVRDGGGVKLLYSYRNDKNPEKAASSFSDHKGYSTLVLNEKDEIFEGNYFNNPSNNRNHGKLFLQRRS